MIYLGYFVFFLLLNNLYPSGHTFPNHMLVWGLLSESVCACVSVQVCEVHIFNALELRTGSVIVHMLRIREDWVLKAGQDCQSNKNIKWHTHAQKHMHMLFKQQNYTHTCTLAYTHLTVKHQSARAHTPN